LFSPWAAERLPEAERLNARLSLRRLSFSLAAVAH